MALLWLSAIIQQHTSIVPNRDAPKCDKGYGRLLGRIKEPKVIQVPAKEDNRSGMQQMPHPLYDGILRNILYEIIQGFCS